MNIEKKYAPSLVFFKKIVLEIINRIDLLQDLVIFQQKKEQKIIGDIKIIGNIYATGEILQQVSEEEILLNDAQKVKAELNNYLKLNTPLDFEEMEIVGVLEDYKTYVKEAKVYLNENKIVLMASTIQEIIPEPSLKLQQYYKERK